MKYATVVILHNATQLPTIIYSDKVNSFPKHSCIHFICIRKCKRIKLFLQCISSVLRPYSQVTHS